MNTDILHDLQERVKELTALHKTARILQDETKSPQDVVREITALLPRAWQYPEITGARIRFREFVGEVGGFTDTPWRQSAAFATTEGDEGSLEICYCESRPPADEGPFLKEERELINSLAEMLRSYFQRWLADQQLRRAHHDLERLVNGRTEELRRANVALQSQIREYQTARREIETHHRQLRQLAAELSLAEARERRAIASDLHDHIGQALAFIKMSISQFRGNAVFCGFEAAIDEITGLLDQTIAYTRNLTFEISPPVLYELGLEAALEWLADRFQRKHKLRVNIRCNGEPLSLSDDVKVILFKSVHELLTNVVKHARAEVVTISMVRDGGESCIVVTDDGCGFEMDRLTEDSAPDEHFGLLNIRERLNYMGGHVEIKSGAGRGTTVRLSVPCAPA